MRFRNWMSLCIPTLIFVCGACNFPGPPLRTEGQTATSAAETLRVRATQVAQASRPAPATGRAPTGDPTVVTPLASPTATHTPTSTPTPTATLIPCNRAVFVRDVNYPDGTEVEINSAITKTWRLRNTGSCPWTSAYQLVFERGDQMGAPLSTPLASAPVPPGETVDVSVELTLPAEPGGYQGFFLLRSDKEVEFGIGANGRDSFWVQIEVIDIPRVDLQVESLSLDPETPTQGEEVAVTVIVSNAGEGPADEFSVGWWPGEDYDDAGCTWTVPSLSASASTTLNCSYAGYPSFYASINTLARADVGSAIPETDESNNSASLEIQVLEP